MRLHPLALAALIAALPSFAADAPFRAAVAQKIVSCWNIGPLSPEAQAASVTLAVEFDPDGLLRPETVRLIASDAPAAIAQEAFEAARRAVLRCGASGLPLPPDHYDHWRHMELTFTAGAYIS